MVRAGAAAAGRRDAPTVKPFATGKFAQGRIDDSLAQTDPAAAAKAAPLRPTDRELEKMRQRLFQCGEVAEAAMWLRRAGKAAGL